MSTIDWSVVRTLKLSGYAIDSYLMLWRKICLKMRNHFISLTNSSMKINPDCGNFLHMTWEQKKGDSTDPKKI